MSQLLPTTTAGSASFDAVCARAAVDVVSVNGEILDGVVVDGVVVDVVRLVVVVPPP